MWHLDLGARVHMCACAAQLVKAPAASIGHGNMSSARGTCTEVGGKPWPYEVVLRTRRRTTKRSNRNRRRRMRP